jgi:ABC-2 type transport system permease protein
VTLFRAELLKIRKRLATYVVLGILLALMALVFVLVGVVSAGRVADDRPPPFLRFPAVYGVMNQFIFGLGSLLAVAYAAAIAGGDWTWGVFRVVATRGESRARYVLVKAAAVAVTIVIGTLIAFVVAHLLTFLAAFLAGMSPGTPFSATSLEDLASSLGLGLPVLLERSALGFAVATVLRSQIAGIISGIVFFLGEGILSTVLLLTTVASMSEGGGMPSTFGPEWYQFLPFSIGDSVLAEAPGVPGGNMAGLILRDVPLATALLVTLGYLVLALAASVLVAERREIRS